MIHNPAVLLKAITLTLTIIICILAVIAQNHNNHKDA